MIKRFYLDKAENGELVIIDDEKGGYITINDADVIVDLLNKLNEQVIMLKLDCEDYELELSVKNDIHDEIHWNLHQKDIKIKELKKDLIKKDNIIKASNRIIDMYVPEDEHDFVAEVINDAMEEGK